MKTIVRMLAAVLVSVCALDGASAEAKKSKGTIELSLRGFANDAGVAQIALFDRAEAFPSDSKRALRTLRVRPKDRKARVALKDLPHGTYAIAVLHDENSNGKLDTNFLGIPIERLGASNDAPFRFGPPSWSDARFVLDEEKLPMKITLRSVL